MSGRCVACDAAAIDGRVELRRGKPVTGGELRRCGACGTVQVMPRPAAADLERLYERDYWQDFEANYGVAGGVNEVSPALAARLAELARRLGGPGRIVDVGCGEGHLVAHAREAGWDAVGVEPSAWASEQARSRYGVTVHNCPLEEAPIQAGSVDVVHANHVVEHLIDPVATLRAAARILRPGGLLAIEVPQELRTPLSDRVLGHLYRWPAAQLPEVTHHLEFFSLGGLATAVRRAGFEVLRCTTVRQQKSLESRWPLGLGRGGRRALYWLEERQGSAPAIVLLARRPGPGVAVTSRRTPRRRSTSPSR